MWSVWEYFLKFIGGFFLKGGRVRIIQATVMFLALFFPRWPPLLRFAFVFVFFPRHKNAALFPGELIVPLVPGSEGDCINGGFSVSGP